MWSICGCEWLLGSPSSAAGCAQCPCRQLPLLTYDGCPADGLRGSAAPGGSGGSCPPVHGSLGEERVLQRPGLARGEQHLEQLPLPPQPLGEGPVGGGSHGLEAQLRSQAPPRLLLHLHSGVTQKRFQVGQLGNRLQAEPAGSQGLTCGERKGVTQQSIHILSDVVCPDFQSLFHRLGRQSASSSPTPNALGLAHHSELGLELKLLIFLLISACSDNYDFSSPFSDFKKVRIYFQRSNSLLFLSFPPAWLSSSPPLQSQLPHSYGYWSFPPVLLIFRTQLTLARGIPARGLAQTLTREKKTHPDFFPDWRSPSSHFGTNQKEISLSMNWAANEKQGRVHVCVSKGWIKQPYKYVKFITDRGCYGDT